MTPSIHDQIAARRAAVSKVCRKYGVSQLDCFGSAPVRSSWRPGVNGLHFLVAFQPEAGGSMADRYLGLAEELEALFDQPVDVLIDMAIRDPFVMAAILETRVPVYRE